MSLEDFKDNSEINFSNQEGKLKMKMHEYRTSGEEKGEEWANKIQEMFNERKKAIIEANKTFNEAEAAFRKVWEEMDDFVKEELQYGV